MVVSLFYFLLIVNFLVLLSTFVPF